MIGSDWCRMMARYNAWQNAAHFWAANALADAERRADRGAFFGSIHGTLSHLLWADHMWLSRFTDRSRPEASQADSPAYEPDWDRLRARRAETDDALAAWADGMTPDVLSGTYQWRSGSTGREESRPMALIVTHVFNHQTHHWAQVHAMLTAAGARPEPTDLFVMPEAA